MPFSTCAIVVLIFSTALDTPLPPKRPLSPSRSSSASNSPVDAPLGAAPLPMVPSVSQTSASTVGLPLESMISLPITFSISKYAIILPKSFPTDPFCPVCSCEAEGVTMILSHWLVYPNHH